MAVTLFGTHGVTRCWRGDPASSSPSLVTAVSLPGCGSHRHGVAQIIAQQPTVLKLSCLMSLCMRVTQCIDKIISSVTDKSQGWRQICIREKEDFFSSLKHRGNSLAVQWLGPHAFTAEGVGSIPGQETAIPQAMQHSQKNLKKQKHEAQKTSTEEGSPRQRLCLPGSCRDAPVDPGWATRCVEARRWEGPPSPEQTASDVPSGRGTLTRHLSSYSFRISENHSSWARSSVL